MKKAKQKLTLLPRANLEPGLPIEARSRFLVSTAEKRVTWPKNVRLPRPDAQNAIGLEEATSRDAPKHLKSKQPLKNPPHLGIRDPAPFKE